MKTIWQPVKPEDNLEEVLEPAAKIIQRGGLVAFPTETVYGLGADGLNPEASPKIYAAKGRPSDNPLIIHISQEKDLERLTGEIPPMSTKLAEAFWPGPLTMIFPKGDLVPKETTGGLDTVAVRMPSHPVARALIRLSHCLIAAPSANTSGRPSPTRAEHVKEDLDGKIHMILDGGPVAIGLESTVVDVTGKVPVILRPGYITQGMLEAVLEEEVQVDRAILAENQEKGFVPKAPGMKYKHYAPKADLFLVEGKRDKVITTINHLVEKRRQEGKKVAVIAPEETAGCYQADLVSVIGSRQEDETIARNLFDILRQMDAGGIQVIYSESFGEGHLGAAIMNRLLKAAGHQVITV